jgi:hypothetical protein
MDNIKRGQLNDPSNGLFVNAGLAKQVNPLYFAAAFHVLEAVVGNAGLNDRFYILGVGGVNTHEVNVAMVSGVGEYKLNIRPFFCERLTQLVTGNA